MRRRQPTYSQAQTVAAAEVGTDAASGAPLLAQVNYGPYAEATQVALEQIAARPTVTSGSYEVRVLRCAAIYLMAFWLKADADGADSVYPMAPTPKGVQASREYSEADFMNAIRPLAQRRAEARGQTNSPLRSL